MMEIAGRRLLMPFEGKQPADIFKFFLILFHTHFK
jgi:hypothetical protein